VTISEGTPVGTPILTVTATDVDAEENTLLVYSIDEEAAAGKLS